MKQQTTEARRLPGRVKGTVLFAHRGEACTVWHPCRKGGEPAVSGVDSVIHQPLPGVSIDSCGGLL